MNILTSKNDNIVQFYGNIESGVYPADPNREIYKISNDNGTQYCTMNWVKLFHVESLPNDFEEYKYCYTETEGFYVNPNYKEPEPPLEEQVSQLKAENEELKKTQLEQDELIAQLLFGTN